mmetsp:Transcript_17330/g.55603  ORF Transcript_17330/g.55603 Transcript_17330/m.55603 type:complete len:364 (+) Transcript_17330:395-1486(+)
MPTPRCAPSSSEFVGSSELDGGDVDVLDVLAGVDIVAQGHHLVEGRHQVHLVPGPREGPPGPVVLVLGIREVFVLRRQPRLDLLGGSVEDEGRYEEGEAGGEGRFGTPLGNGAERVHEGLILGGAGRGGEAVGGVRRGGVHAPAADGEERGVALEGLVALLLPELGEGHRPPLLAEGIARGNHNEIRERDRRLPLGVNLSLALDEAVHHVLGTLALFGASLELHRAVGPAGLVRRLVAQRVDHSHAHEANVVVLGEGLGDLLGGDRLKLRDLGGGLEVVRRHNLLLGLESQSRPRHGPHQGIGCESGAEAEESLAASGGSSSRVLIGAGEGDYGPAVGAAGSGGDEPRAVGGGGAGAEGTCAA